jgi:putative serine protease PepD
MARVRLRGRDRRVAAALAALMLATGVSACSSGGPGAIGQGAPLQRAYESTIKRVLNSVVQINAGRTTGSGVVFDSRGDIVTNAHVVGTAKRFDVLSTELSRPLKARLVGLFTPDDLAVIRVSNGPPILRPAHWANSASAQVGQIVLAVGAPYGLVDSVTQGIVSATGRTVTGPPIQGKPPTAIPDAIQTSAAINPGNSGGALVLLSGFVIGIPTLEAQDPELGTSAEGIGFAIPANTVRDVATQLIRFGKVIRSDRASLDITGRTHVTGSGTPDGVSVAAAKPGGAAASAGIKVGDIIVGLDGQAVESVDALETALINYRPSQRVEVKVLRAGKTLRVMARLGNLAG